MSVKLLLNPAAEARECTHRETGIKFKIRPINPEQYHAIRHASLDKDGNIYPPLWGANFAVAAIADWGKDVGDKSGPLPCSEENLKIFGRNQIINIMPWVINEATSLDQYRIEEEQAGKNA